MKTIIELFDQEAINNILAASIFRPKHIAYICDRKMVNANKKEAIRRLLKSRNIDAEASFYVLDSSNLAKIFSAFERTIKLNEDCVFDLTGGKELMLLGAGIFCKERGIPGYYIDLKHNRIINIFGCEDIAGEFQVPIFSVEEVLMASGALLERYGRYLPEEDNEAMDKDSLLVWDILKANSRYWTKHITYLQQGSNMQSSPEELSLTMPKKIGVNKNLTVHCNTMIMKQLYTAGILTSYEDKGDEITFEYKNSTIKKRLLDYGIWLELYSFIKTKQLNYFDDVQSSVIIDWDGKVEEGVNTRNEIDLIMVKGIRPIFASCKLGMPTPLDFGEIRFLADRFGVGMAKPVIITGADMNTNPALYQRARDMKIYIIDDNDIKADRLGQKLIEISENRFNFR